MSFLDQDFEDCGIELNEMSRGGHISYSDMCRVDSLADAATNPKQVDWEQAAKKYLRAAIMESGETGYGIPIETLTSRVIDAHLDKAVKAAKDNNDYILEANLSLAKDIADE